MARTKIQGYVDRGGTTVSTAGFVSTTAVDGSFPSATVTVYISGTQNLATIYSTITGVAKANPFTADANAFYFFWTDQALVDLTFSGSTIPAPFTISNVSGVSGSSPFSNILDFGALFDGVTDDTVSWQAAIAATPNGGTIVAPAGISLITDTVTINHHRIRIVGAGAQASWIKFQPTSGPKAAFSFDLGSGEIVENAFIGFGFTSTDATFQKIMVKLVGAGQCEIANIASADGQWTGANSIGLQTFGHENLSCHDVLLAADNPINIQPNPYIPTLDADHFHFWNCYLLANNNPCISVAAGTVLSNTTFDGYQAWVRGTSGFSWAGTNVASSLAVSIRNARWEQQQGGAGWFVDISGTTGVVGLELTNLYGGLGAKGIQLRSVSRPIITDYTYIGTSVAFDINSTVAQCAWINSHAGVAPATVSVTGQDPVLATNVPSTNTTPHRTTVYYSPSSNGVKSIQVYGTNMWCGHGTIASGGFVNLPVSGSERSFVVFVSAHNNTTNAPEGGTVIVTGSAGGSAVLASGTTNFGVGNVAGKLTIFWQNNSIISLFNQLGGAATADYTMTVFWN